MNLSSSGFTSSDQITPNGSTSASTSADLAFMEAGRLAEHSFRIALITLISMWFLWLIPVVSLCSSFVAVKYGHTALKALKENIGAKADNNSHTQHKDLANRGLILGYLSLVPSIFWCSLFLSSILKAF